MGIMKQRYIQQMNTEVEQRQDAINHLHDARNILKVIHEEYNAVIHQIIMELENEQDKKGVGDLKETKLYSAYDDELDEFSGRINYTDRVKLINEIFGMLWNDVADPEHDDKISVPQSEREEYIQCFGKYTIREHNEPLNILLIGEFRCRGCGVNKLEREECKTIFEACFECCLCEACDIRRDRR